MSAKSYKDFSLGIGGEEVFRTAGCTRYDVAVDGSVNVVISPNGVDKTIDTITDTAKNVYWANSFKLVGVTAAVGTVTALDEGSSK